LRDHGATVLPDEATLVASWSALAQLSPGARMDRSPSTLAVVVASWAPPTNAILREAPDLQSTAMPLTAQQ